MADFTSQNELETLFVAGFADPAARPEYYRAFLEGQVVVMDANPPNGPHPPKDADLRVRMLQVEGVTHLPVFTSLKRVEEYGHREGHCIAIRTRALLQAVPDTPVIVNPGSQYTMAFSKAEIAALLAGKMFRSNGPDKQQTAVGGLELTPVTDPPLDLLRRIVQLFRARESVRAAYVVNVRNAGEKIDAHPLVCVEAAAAGWEALAREIIEIVDANCRPGEVVDVCRLDDRPFSARLRKESKSFFRR